MLNAIKQEEEMAKKKREHWGRRYELIDEALQGLDRYDVVTLLRIVMLDQVQKGYQVSPSEACTYIQNRIADIARNFPPEEKKSVNLKVEKQFFPSKIIKLDIHRKRDD